MPCPTGLVARRPARGDRLALAGRARPAPGGLRRAHVRGPGLGPAGRRGPVDGDRAVRGGLRALLHRAVDRGEVAPAVRPEGPAARPGGPGDVGPPARRRGRPGRARVLRRGRRRASSCRRCGPEGSADRAQAQGGVVVGEGPHRARRGVPGLEAHRDPTASRAPDPPRPVRVVLHVEPRRPARARRAVGVLLGRASARLATPDPASGSGSVSPSGSSAANRSSCSRSVSPVTPTPSSRTPPVRSSASSSDCATLVITSTRSVAPTSVRARVSVEKSGRRTLIARSGRTAAAVSRAATWRACRRRISASSARSLTSVAKVSSVEIDFASRSASTGRSSRAQARPASVSAWALPTTRTSSSGSTSRRSATVRTPIRSSRSRVTGPTPKMTPTPIGPMRSTSVPGSITHRPSGFSSSLAILARNLDEADPDRGGQAAGDAVRPPSAPARALAGLGGEVDGPGGGPQVHERLVERQRLDQGDSARSRPITWPLASR